MELGKQIGHLGLFAVHQFQIKDGITKLSRAANQEELRKLSSRIKFGHQQAIKSNVVLGNSNIFGYKKVDKIFTVNYMRR